MFLRTYHKLVMSNAGSRKPVNFDARSVPRRTFARPTLWFEHCQLISAEQSPEPPIECNQVTAQHAHHCGDPGVR